MEGYVIIYDLLYITPLKCSFVVVKSLDTKSFPIALATSFQYTVPAAVANTVVGIYRSCKVYGSIFGSIFMARLSARFLRPDCCGPIVAARLLQPLSAIVHKPPVPA